MRSPQNFGIALACLAAMACRGNETPVDDPVDTQTTQATLPEGTWPTVAETLPEPGMPEKGCYLLTSSYYGPVVISRITETGLEPEAQIDHWNIYGGIHQVHGLTWFDDVWYACSNNVIRIDPETSTASQSDIRCQGLGRWGSNLALTNPNGSAYAYATEADLLADTPSAEIGTGNLTVSRGAIVGTEFYGAWHSTERLEVVNLDDGLHRTLPLQGFDTWVWGVAAIDGKVLVLDDGRADNSGDVSVWYFDAATGEQTHRVTVSGDEDTGLGGWQAGLWCSPGATAR